MIFCALIHVIELKLLDDQKLGGTLRKSRILSLTNTAWWHHSRPEIPFCLIDAYCSGHWPKISPLDEDTELSRVEMNWVWSEKRAMLKTKQGKIVPLLTSVYDKSLDLERSVSRNDSSFSLSVWRTEFSFLFLFSIFKNLKTKFSFSSRISRFLRKISLSLLDFWDFEEKNPFLFSIFKIWIEKFLFLLSMYKILPIIFLSLL